MPQVPMYDSTPIIILRKKWKHLVNSSILHTVSDFVLPPLHQMPTPSKQLSQITVSESDVFRALISLNAKKAQGCDNINPVRAPPQG